MNSLPSLPLRPVRLIAAALLTFALASRTAAAAPASSLPDDALLRIKFDQKINSQVTADLRFRDESGRPIRLGDYLGEKPTILVLGYYGCPMLCTLVLNGMVECLQDLKMDLGKEFQVVNVSINPLEGPELAAAKKRTYLQRYGRSRADSGWHFLTGDEIAIRQLADEVGFRYAYDPAIRQYAHPSGLVVLTPQGKIARYFFGINFPPKELSSTLREAEVEKTGSVVDQFILLCFHYSPLRGPYGRLIMAILRLAGLATVLGIVAIVLRARQRLEPRHAGSVLPASVASEESSPPAPAFLDSPKEEKP